MPARDEEATVEACLRALLVAVDRCPVPARVVLVDDGSRDATGRLARELLQTPHRVVAGPGTDVGSARRHGAQVAARGVVDPTATWLASTDADSVVPPDWLARQVDHAVRGVDALAGVVRLGPGGNPGTAAAFRDHYGVATTGPHTHLHAANLGIRLATLQSAGSWAPRTHAEEHDLWRRLPATARVVADAALMVTTSPRRRGRAPIGFAADLDRLHRRLAATGRIETTVTGLGVAALDAAGPGVAAGRQADAPRVHDATAGGVRGE